MATKQRRAKAGGEIGANGLHYAGGTFIANTALQPLEKPARRASTRKQEIDRYKWEVAPSVNHFSIYTVIAGTVAVRGADGLFSRNEPGIAYYGSTLRGYSVDELIARFNAGERWAEVKA